jgi:hypothetical protein
MTETPRTSDERAGSIGYRLGVAFRIVTLAFFTTVVGVVIGAGSGERWTMPIAYAAIGASLLSLLGFLTVGRSAAAAAWAAYVALVGVGAVLQTRDPRQDAALVAITIGAVAAGAAGVVLMMRTGRRRRELDRLMFTEATSVAFFVTMMSALGYALLESWIEAPKLSMWFVWTVGVGSWIVASFAFRRRYS